MGEIRDRLLDAYWNPQPYYYEYYKWDYRFLKLAQEVASWSKDPSTQVGAVVVDANRHIVGTGYNGFPVGVKDLPERYENRELKYKLVVHAEVNACIQAGRDARGATLYVWPAFGIPPVCNECCKVIIQSGIARVVGLNPDPNDERAKRWVDSLEISKMMLKEAGVTFYGIDPNNNI